MDLFDQQIIPVPLAEGRKSHMVFWPNWLKAQPADRLLARAIAETPWRFPIGWTLSEYPLRRARATPLIVLWLTTIAMAKIASIGMQTMRHLWVQSHSLRP